MGTPVLIKSSLKCHLACGNFTKNIQEYYEYIQASNMEMMEEFVSEVNEVLLALLPPGPDQNSCIYTLTPRPPHSIFLNSCLSFCPIRICRVRENLKGKVQETIKENNCTPVE